MEICCSSWSFRREMARHLSIFDFPAWCGSEGIRTIEIHERHLPGQDGHFVEQLHHACDHAGVGIACLALDTDFTLADEGKRFAQLERTRAMLHEIAAPLHIPVVQVQVGSADRSAEAEQRARTILSGLAPDLRETGIALALGNNAGLPAPLFGSCPDLGNLSPEQRYDMLAELLPSARHLHALSCAFDAHGWETTIDYRRVIAILKEFGYNRAISIVFAGEGDPAQGVLMTKSLIEQLWNTPEQAMAA